MTEKLIDLRDGGSIKAHILLKRTDLDFVFFSVTVLSGVVLATAMVGWRFGGLEDSWRPSHDDAWSVRQLRPQLKLEVLEASGRPSMALPLPAASNPPPTLSCPHLCPNNNPPQPFLENKEQNVYLSPKYFSSMLK